VKTSALLVLAAGLLFGACSDSTAPAPDLSNGFPRTGAITVLTRNAYIGADVDAVIAALMSPDDADDLPALLTAIATLQATDLPTRAAAFANEIAIGQPDVVGFQEITQLDIDLSALGGPAVTLDFLPAIQAALAARGLNYAVGGQNKNIDITLLGGAIQMVDYDVVLYNADRVQWQTLVAKTFTYNLGPIADGVVLERGFVAGTAALGDVTYAIVSTHPEPDLNPQIQLPDLRAAQIAEVLAVLDGAEPAVIMGDLNDDPGSPMYLALVAAGFADVWAELRPEQVGYTCCHASDLSNEQTAFDQRIDYVFARGVEHRLRAVTGRVDLVGDSPGDRSAGPFYPIWPSDYAGVLAKLLIPVGGVGE